MDVDVPRRCEEARVTVEPLKTQVVSGVRWSLTSHAGKHVLQLLSTVVLITLLEIS